MRPSYQSQVSSSFLFKKKKKKRVYAYINLHDPIHHTVDCGAYRTQLPLPQHTWNAQSVANHRTSN